MPTFTTIALENLLQHPKNSSTLKNPQPKFVANHDEAKKEEEESNARKRLNHVYISPALYTTPEPTPILDYSSSGSVSPSPYVFNRKGRGGGGKSANQRIDGFEVQGSGNQMVGNSSEAFQIGEDDEVFGGGGRVENRLVVEGECEDGDADDFADPRCDSFSVASSSDLNDSGRLGLDNLSLVSNQIGEFYDATEDFSSDGSILSLAACNRNLESELHTIKVSLLEEIEKRKAAECDLAAMCSHCKKFSELLQSQTGVTSSNDSSSTMQFDINAMKQLFEEVIVTRFVAEAMGKAEARAEAEQEANVIIGSKDKELSRLRDRLQYYEAMIHEMSQKNLESMEEARRQRELRKGRKKWLWSFIGTSIVVGASVIAYSYAPQHHQPLQDTQSEAAAAAYD